MKKGMMKQLLAGALAIVLTIGMTAPLRAEAQSIENEVIVTAPLLSVPDNKVLTYTYQKAQDFVINVTNPGSEQLKDVVVRPVLEDSSDKWPFKTDYQSYSSPPIATLDPGQTVSVKFDFMERDNIPTARYTLHFLSTVEGKEVSKSSFYVNTTAKPEEKNNNTDPGKQSAVPDAMQFAAAGGVSNSDAVYNGGGDGSSTGTGSVPRVIVTGFNTDPGEVRAGSNFKLIIHLKNTSKTTKVSNMLFDLQAPTEGADQQATAPAFLPSSGSSSIYLEGIPADGAADIEILLNAKGDLLQKPYSMNMSMKYEDGNAAQIEGASSISIPIKQDARFEFSEFEISPETIAVGEEANVMCSLYNLGRIKLYNVKATFEGKGIKKEEVFVGNVESGASASIDGMLKGEKESQGPSKVTMTVSYEDEAGKSSSTTKELQLDVTAEKADDMAMTMMQEPVKSGFPVVPVVGGAIALVAILAIVLLIRRKKRKIMAEEEEELLNELDGSAEDER